MLSGTLYKSCQSCPLGLNWPRPGGHHQNLFLLNILKTNRPIKTKFCMHIIIDKIYVGIINHCFFCKFATELPFLIDFIIWFLLNILRKNKQIETKFCKHIIIDKIFVDIVNFCFLQICNRVTALDLCQNSVFTQYLENKLTE